MCVCVCPPSCPRLRRTISCLAPMLPRMASSSLAFMSLDFLKVRLFIRSKAFFPCMVNTTWALVSMRWERGAGERVGRGESKEREEGGGVKVKAAQHSKQSRLVVQGGNVRG